MNEMIPIIIIIYLASPMTITIIEIDERACERHINRE